jgi:hypothetical protein
MKKMTTETPRQRSWLRAIAEAAREQGVSLPSFTGHAMGAARSLSVEDGRFITFKRRFLPASQAEADGIEWALWREQDNLPIPVAAFREPLEPKPENVATALRLLKGWLVDGWTPEEAKAAVTSHPRAQPVEEMPPPNGEKLGIVDAEAIEALERFVVENDDLLELESEIGKFNIFDALRIARAEIRHSNFLAFLLDPAESHAQGQLFLKPVLMDLLKVARPNLRPLSPIDLDRTDLRGVEVRREWEHIDLLIACQEPSFVVVIENKVGSKERPNQLSRYERVVKLHYPNAQPLFVYLTPDADEPSKDNWVAYSYRELHRVLTRVRKAYGNAIGEDILVFLSHYLSLIGTRFMNDPTIDELCKRIYKNHRRALDLIFARAVGPGSGIMAEAATVVGEDPRWHVFSQTDRRIAFVPKSWLAWLPGIGVKDDPRSWLFLRLYLYDEMLEFVVQVHRMKDLAKRKTIVNRLIDQLPGLGFKKSKSGKDSDVTRVSGSDPVLKWSEDEQPEPETIRAAVKKKLDEVYPKLEGVRSVLDPLLK